MMEYNVYCDESCYLENDDSNVMSIGCIWCPKDKTKEIANRIKEIKNKYYLDSKNEIKWSKVSNCNSYLYLDIINYFFDNDDIHFRVIVIKDKKKLDHKKYHQTHEDFYYKTYFTLLKNMLNPNDKYNIYIDIKNNQSNSRAQKLREICSNSMYDFSMTVINKIQPINSKESQILQLADLLIGACTYANRIFNDVHHKCETKIKIIDRIKYRSKYKLDKSTLLGETKFNYFLWRTDFYEN
ncbi:MAG: DUF3800 domain-containing protein [Acholeplasmatales bacterium]|nr:DUF3800 domain-containing protein [Acholeplasmatales bacterium]